MSSAVVGCSSPFLGVCGSLYSVAVADSSSTVRGGLASSATLRPSARSPVHLPSPSILRPPLGPLVCPRLFVSRSHGRRSSPASCEITHANGSSVFCLIFKLWELNVYGFVGYLGPCELQTLNC